MVLVFTLSQCSSNQGPTPYTYELKKGWEAPPIPKNNPLTLESIALGRSLFFENALSVDSSISCSSCHLPASGFADRIPLSLGVEGRVGFRNSGTLTNVAYLPYFNRDGGVKTLDIFSSVPIEDHQEMGFNMLLAGQRLKNNPKYAKAAKEVYGREFDGFVITRALGSFLRTFISDNSLYDKVLNGEDGIKFNQSQLEGKKLFFGDKAHCSKCHSGIQFSDYSFQNNGLFDNYEDKGRQRLTFNPDDEGKFRVATLRNIELTAPYMHNGSLPTLESVLQHYASHGSQHKNKNQLIDEITLTADDQKHIIAFLKTLTDKEFINNPAFVRPPTN